jgi:hypothetical protein
VQRPLTVSFVFPAPPVVPTSGRSAFSAWPFQLSARSRFHFVPAILRSFLSLRNNKRKLKKGKRTEQITYTLHIVLKIAF